MVSALELLVGLDGASTEKFPQAKERIDLAYDVSKGRILEEPVFLLCKEALRVPFPAKLERPRPEVIADYIQIVRCAKSLDEIRQGRVQVNKLRTKGQGRAGFAGLERPVVKELLAGPKKEWVERSEILASEIYPQSRDHFLKTGKRLPDKIRQELKSRHVWNAEKTKFTETKLRWLQVRTTPQLVADITKKLDAVLEFTIFVHRESLLGNYNLEKHDSDVYDQFQLHYLALDRFVIVTEDSDLLKRTANSGQAGRIFSFKKFLASL